jgi:hypothetical protein
MFKFLSKEDKHDEEYGQELSSKSFNKQNDFDNSNTAPKSETDSIMIDDPLQRSWIDLQNNEKRTFLTQSGPASLPSHSTEEGLRFM